MPTIGTLETDLTVDATSGRDAAERPTVKLQFKFIDVGGRCGNERRSGGIPHLVSLLR
jgi:hypothetical protein